MDTKTIIAQEFDGKDYYYSVIKCKLIDDPTLDLHAAVQNACAEFLRTPEGKNIYAMNNQSFNWVDFSNYVPNNINKKHGFYVTYDSDCIIAVDLNEDLSGNVNWDED